MSQVRCLIVTTHFRPLIGGALTVYDALARCAPDQIALLTASSDYTNGHEVDGWRAFDRDAPYEITRLAALRPQMLAPGAGIIAKIISKFKGLLINRRVLRETTRCALRGNFDVVCIGAQDALGWMVKPLQDRTNAKVIIYVHGEEVSQVAYSDKAESQRKTALKAADGLTAVSSFTAGLLSTKYGVPMERIQLQNNGVDLQTFNGVLRVTDRTKYRLPNGPYVFSCGRLVERKGFDKLIEAWPKVAAAMPGVKLVIGGKGPLEAGLIASIAKLGIGDSVQMLGWIEEGALASCYGFADLFIMPNRTMPDGDTEGFGLVFLEAAAMGTPSIAGRAGGAVDAVIDGETGLFVDGNNTGEISSALIEILSNDTRRQAMAKAAQKHARTQGWQVKTLEFLDFVGRLKSCS